MGLGTKAVDRTDDDYPRIVNLDRPAARSHASTAERHRFSQHSVDVIDRERRQFRSVDCETVRQCLPGWFCNLMYEHDTDAEASLRDSG